MSEVTNFANLIASLCKICYLSLLQWWGEKFIVFFLFWCSKFWNFYRILRDRCRRDSSIPCIYYRTDVAETALYLMYITGQMYARQLYTLYILQDRCSRDSSTPCVYYRKMYARQLYTLYILQDRCSRDSSIPCIYYRTDVAETALYLVYITGQM